MIKPRTLQGEIRVERLASLFRVVRAMPHFNQVGGGDPLAVVGYWLSPTLFS